MKILNDRDARATELRALAETLHEPDLGVEAIARGWHRDELLRRILDRQREKPLIDLATATFGGEARDLGGYSITRACRAQYDRNWQNAGLEQAVSDSITTRSGRAPNGSWVPLSLATRDFNVGTANQAGNTIGADRDRDGRWTRDPLRALSGCLSLGASVLPNQDATLSLPYFSSTTTASWLTEVQAATDVAETTTHVEFTPKRSAVTFVMSLNALFAAQPVLDKLIIRHLTAALMARLDDGMLNGSGSGAEPRGLRNTTGIGTVVGGTDGAQLAWSHLVDLEALPATANAPGAAAGWLFNGATRKWLRKTARGSGLDFILPADMRLLGHPAVVCGNVPSNLTKGASNGVCSSVLYGSDWSALAAVFYGPVAIDLVVDRITLADVGKVRIVAAIYVGAGCLSPGCFGKMDDALTA